MRALATVQIEDGYTYKNIYGIFPNNVIVSRRAKFNYKLFSEDVRNNSIQFKADDEVLYTPSYVLDYNRYVEYDTKTVLPSIYPIYASNTLTDITHPFNVHTSINLDFRGINNNMLHDSNYLYAYHQDIIYVSEYESSYDEADMIASLTIPSGLDNFQALTVMHADNDAALEAIGSYFIYLTETEVNIVVWDGTSFVDNILTFPTALNDSHLFLQRLHERFNTSDINGVTHCNNATFIFACSSQKDETYFIKIELDKIAGIVSADIIQNTQETNSIDRTSYDVLVDTTGEGSIFRVTNEYMSSLSIAEELNATYNIANNGTIFFNAQIDYDAFIFQDREFGVYEEHNKLYLYTSVVSYLNNTMVITPVFIYMDLAFPATQPPFKVWGYAQGGNASDISFVNYSPSISLKPNIIQKAANIMKNKVDIIDDSYHHSIPDILDLSVTGITKIKLSIFNQITIINSFPSSTNSSREVKTIQFIMQQAVTDNRIYPAEYNEVQIPYVNILEDLRKFTFDTSTLRGYFLEEFQYRYLPNSPNIYYRKAISDDAIMPKVISFYKIIDNELIFINDIAFDSASSLNERIIYDSELCTLIRTSSVGAAEYAPNSIFSIFSMNDYDNYNIHIRDAYITDDLFNIHMKITAMYLSHNIRCYIHISIPDYVNLVINDDIGGTGYVKSLLIHLDRSIYSTLTFKAEDNTEITQESIKDINLVNFKLMNHTLGTQHLEITD